MAQSMGVWDMNAMAQSQRESGSDRFADQAYDDYANGTNPPNTRSQSVHARPTSDYVGIQLITETNSEITNSHVYEIQEVTTNGMLVAEETKSIQSVQA